MVIPPDVLLGFSAFLFVLAGLAWIGDRVDEREDARRRNRQ